jgi:lipoprotein-anchoring transpeptidase ErfK/SrfK
VKRVGLGLLALGLALAGFVATPLTAGTPRAPKAGPIRLPSGVKIGAVHVGGLTPSAAYMVVRLAYRTPVVVSLGKRRYSVPPSELGVTPYFWSAVERAEHARPGSTIPLTVTVRGADVHSFVSGLQRRFDRQPVDAKEGLRDLRPHVAPEVVGRAVAHWQAVAAIVRTLRENRRGPVVLPVKALQPKVRASDFGSLVVIRRDSKQLYLYDGARFVRRFPVATGQAIYPTPIGDFHVITMWRNPWWYPPDSDWAKGEKPIPPGPGNPLGTRWMGISSPGVGMHGTPDPASIGYSASHGCIRMFIPDAEWLFNHVRIGTPVFIRPV